MSRHLIAYGAAAAVFLSADALWLGVIAKDLYRAQIGHLLAPDFRVAPAPHECDKLFYVSPFMDMPLRYRFLLSPPNAGAFSLRIIERDRAGVVLTALMQARVFAPTRANLLKRLIASPLAGFGILARIHAQALRLWWRGHRIRHRPTPPTPVSVAEAGAYSHSVPQLTDQTHA